MWMIWITVGYDYKFCHVASNKYYWKTLKKNSKYIEEYDIKCKDIPMRKGENILSIKEGLISWMDNYSPCIGLVLGRCCILPNIQDLNWVIQSGGNLRYFQTVTGKMIQILGKS